MIHTTKIPQLNTTIKEQQIFKIKMDLYSSPSRHQLIKRMMQDQRCIEDIRKQLTIVELFFKKTEFNHIGLEKETYLNHPYRVASLLMAYSTKIDNECLLLALVHNVIELTNNDIETLTDIFGLDVAKEINVLTIDREKTGDCRYIKKYYEKIAKSEKASKVKIMDKMDNLPMICFNKDKERRENYLNEIRTYIVELTKLYMPKLCGTIKNMIKECERIGYIERASVEKELGRL